MIKKYLFISLALIGLIFYQMTDYCFAATSDTLAPAKQNVISLIGTGKLAEADTATNKLIADFNNSPGVDEAIQQIAEKHRIVKNYQKAIELSRYVITNRPQSNRAVWSQMEIVMSNMLLGNEESVRSEITTLSTNYSSDPNLPWTLYAIGEQYRWAQNYDQARELYEKIIREHPDIECATKARIALINSDIIANINAGDFASAEKLVDKMLTDFPADSYLPEILLYIGQKFSWSHQYEQASNVFQQIIQRFPTSPIAAKAKQCISKTGQITDIVSKSIESGDYSKAGKAVDELIAKFGDEADTPATIYDIAGRLESAGQFALARHAYEQIIWRYPKDGFADMSRMGVQRTKVLALDESGDLTSAQSTFNGILNDFNGHPYLPAHVMWTAEDYYRKACKAQEQGDIVNTKKYFDKTLQTLDVVNTKFPASTEIPNALYLAGDCYRRLGEYQKSVEFYQKIVDKYPADGRAGRSLFMVGCNLEDMQTLGFASGPEVDEAITAAYKRLIKEYPNCDTVKFAENWLKQHNAQ